MPYPMPDEIDDADTIVTAVLDDPAPPLPEPPRYDPRDLGDAVASAAYMARVVAAADHERRVRLALK